MIDHRKCRVLVDHRAILQEISKTDTVYTIKRWFLISSSGTLVDSWPGILSKGKEASRAYLQVKLYTEP